MRTEKLNEAKELLNASLHFESTGIRELTKELVEYKVAINNELFELRANNNITAAEYEELDKYTSHKLLERFVENYLIELQNNEEYEELDNLGVEY